MAVYTGTSTSHKDLLDDVRGHLVTAGWTVDSYTTNAGITAQDTLYIRGPGSTVTEDVHILIRTQANAGLGLYNWEVRGAIGYDSTLTFVNQPGVSPPVYTLLWENSIQYWLYTSNRRFILVAKVGATYHTVHAGFFSPFATPAAYPYPLYIASDYYTQSVYTITDSGYRNFADPGEDCAYVREADGTWTTIANHENSVGDVDRFLNLPDGAYRMWPYSSGAGFATSKSTLQGLELRSLQSVANTQLVIPLHIFGNSIGSGIIGIVEGAFYVPGFGVSPEQVTTIGADTYRIFSNINRTSYNHYFAVRQV